MSTATAVKPIGGHININHPFIVIKLLLVVSAAVDLLKDWDAMSINLGLLNSASLHVHLLVGYLLHLVPICLFNEGLNRIKFA